MPHPQRTIAQTNAIKNALLEAAPQCEAPIAHGMPQYLGPDEHPLYSRFCVEVREPQESLPGQQKLYSRFCVEVPRAGVGVDWQFNSTTTDGPVAVKLAAVKSAVKSAVSKVASATKSVVLGSDITLRVLKWDGVQSDWTQEPDVYKIKKMKSIYDQIMGKLNYDDEWESVDLCSESDNEVVCSVQFSTLGQTKFDADCKKAIANAEAGSHGKSIYLRVKVEDFKLVTIRRLGYDPEKRAKQQKKLAEEQEFLDEMTAARRRSSRGF
jgi:hypothetical protein